MTDLSCLVDSPPQLALRAAVVVLLVDLTDAGGTLMGRVRDMVGRNPIVMVGTKMDLLPEVRRAGEGRRAGAGRGRVMVTIASTGPEIRRREGRQGRGGEERMGSDTDVAADSMHPPPSILYNPPTQQPNRAPN